MNPHPVSLTTWDGSTMPSPFGENSGQTGQTTTDYHLSTAALVNSSKAGDIVADLFGGSGSTLIGCERRGRKARLMEIDPKYADCIVRRWQEHTGKTAVLEGDGRTFDEIAEERRAAVA